MSCVELTPDVLIVGGGVAGCPLAIALHRQGLDVLLVERLSAPKKIIFKGEYIQPAAVMQYERLGMDRVFDSPSSEKVTELRFRDLNAKGEVISDLLMSYPKSTYARTIHHHDLIKGLQDYVRAELREKFWCGVNLAPLNPEDTYFYRRPRFTAQHPQLGEVLIRPQWVVGADGRQSTVRKWMKGISSPKNDKVVMGSKYEFIFGVELPTPAPKTSRYEVFRSYGKGTLSAFTLGRDGQRIYYSSPEVQGSINKIVSENIGSLLKQIQPHSPIGLLPEEVLVAGFPANTTWFGPAAQGRFLLVGDAAAVTTPYGGQGMTAAMEHVTFLSQEFDWKARRLVDEVYQIYRYEKRVEKIFDRINVLNFWLYYLFFARNTAFKQTTQFVVEHWKKNPEVPRMVMNLFGGLDNDKPSWGEVIEISGLRPAIAGRTAAQLLVRNGLRMISQ